MKFVHRWSSVSEFDKQEPIGKRDAWSSEKFGHQWSLVTGVVCAPVKFDQRWRLVTDGWVTDEVWSPVKFGHRHGLFTGEVRSAVTFAHRWIVTLHRRTSVGDVAGVVGSTSSVVSPWNQYIPEVLCVVRFVSTFLLFALLAQFHIVLCVRCQCYLFIVNARWLHGHVPVNSGTKCVWYVARTLAVNHLLLCMQRDIKQWLKWQQYIDTMPF